jgi:hypothetical protein
MSDLHDMIRISCEETITPDTEAQLEHEAQEAKAQRFQRTEEGSWGRPCEDAPCCGCCGPEADGGSIDDGWGSPADDAWHDANEYPDW